MPDAVTLAAQTGSASQYWNAYTGATFPAATVAPLFINTGGMNGAIMFEIVENNVAGSSSVIIEGSFQNAVTTAGSGLWYPLGYYVIVSAGTTGTSLSRAQGTLAISQNSRYVLQVLDAYPYMRARCTANGSSASLSINVYALAA